MGAEAVLDNPAPANELSVVRLPPPKLTFADPRVVTLDGIVIFDAREVAFWLAEPEIVPPSDRDVQRALAAGRAYDEPESLDPPGKSAAGRRG